MQSGFVKYDPHSREDLVAEVCLAREKKLSMQPSSLRPNLAHSSDQVQEVSTDQNSNQLPRVSFCQS